MRQVGFASASASLMVGCVVALSGVTGAGMLLVEGGGIGRAALGILAVQAGALSAGTWWTGRGGGGHPSPGDPRAGWAWIRTFVALALAALVAAWWQLRGVNGLPLAPWVTLGVLVALPQAALGVLLARLAQGRWITPTVLAGASGGFLVAGSALPRLSPGVVYLGCMALLAGAGMLHAAEAVAPAPADEGGEGS